MHLFVLSALTLVTSVSAQAIQGFNYGSTFTTGAAKMQSDFENEFTTAQNLVGTSGFKSARLYTMVQGGTAKDPISAIPAAIKTKTSLLLGLWASGDTFQNELDALSAAITQYGDSFASIIDGISVGSEDLYRNSPMGIAAKSNIGANPDTIVEYIKKVRKLIAGTSLKDAKIGHVDTWTAWVNTSNSGVVDACDWLGFDGYPYFQDTLVNDIAKGPSLFDDSVAQTKAAAKGKPVWIAETGWPVSGKESGNAEPSLENAKAYWDTIGCAKLFGKVNTWWYVLQDAAPETPNPSFGVVGSKLSTTPLYDLSCDNVTDTSSSSSSPSSTTGSVTATATGSSGSTATGSDAGATPTGTDSSGSGSGTGSNSTYASPTGSASSTSTSTSGPATAAAAGMHSGAFGAAFLALMLAVFAL